MKKKSYEAIISFLCVLLVIQGLVIIALLIRKPKEPRIIPKAKPAVTLQGKIAIVLDDWGYNLDNLSNLKQIRSPLTLSILPNLAYSRRVAEEANQKGFEVILHLPMEPQENFRLEKNTVLRSLNVKSVQDIIDEDLTSIVYAKGVSNHMGSMATADRRLMESVFRKLKSNHLYFLDSFVTGKSVCPGLAKETGLEFAKRDIFLDNENNPAYIKSQIYKLKRRAKAKGYAIGIGHDRKTTLEALKELMPQLEKEGYRFVFVSELVR